ncbi:hypothetical protein M432DRAFT_587288 [Thermoascus aurantiacus ATCC 26904]
MHLSGKISVALVASLAAVGEAAHPLHAHRRHGYNSTDVRISSVFVIPTPLAKAPSESITAAPVPLSTGLAGTVPGADDTLTKTEDITLTYTLGTGTSTTVVTTTIHRTATQTHYVVETPAPAANQQQEEESTTTISSTSTTTEYVTVYPVTTSAANGLSGNGLSESSQSGSSQSGSSQSGNGLGACAPAATVTVIQKEIVTVTATPTPVNVPANDNAVVSTPEVNNQAPTFTTVPVAVPSSPAAPAAPAAPAVPPFGNGTFPIPNKVRPSGFVTSKYPAPSGLRRL